MEKKLKTPISYYGGKQRLASTIISKIPPHNLYCEPFVGGAAVFFAKPPSNVEVINDTNSEMINFYKICQTRFHELQALVRVTLHSRRAHHDAGVVYSNPHLFDELKRAWAVWVTSSQSFSSQLNSSFGYDKSEHTTSLKIANKRSNFTEPIAHRLQNAQIECADALYIIKSRDTPDSFFYCDPPYYNSDCGHYNGYTQADFDELLKLLTGIKGKFLLSSYPSVLLQRYSQDNAWRTWSKESCVSVNAKGKNLKRKVEMLTANYEI